MTNYDTSLARRSVEYIGQDGIKIVRVTDFFNQPDGVVEAAAKQHYARINPHYPGIRADVEPELLACLCETVSTLAGDQAQSWVGQAWYSIVTTPKAQLTPIQRLPHFDGFDEDQLAVMIYLNHTGHGGTAFYRQKATGYEAVTEARFPTYKAELENGVRATGLPTAKYISDGAPHFERTANLGAAYNSLILYPGTALHSGMIDNDLPLSGDPRKGRLTINGFFRPVLSV